MYLLCMTSLTPCLTSSLGQFLHLEYVPGCVCLCVQCMCEGGREGGEAERGRESDDCVWWTLQWVNRLGRH